MNSLGDLVTGTESVGSFRYLVADDVWWLSPVAHVIHGVPAGAEVTTEMIMSFKHPDDRLASIDLLAKVVAVGEPFCFPHRIIDAAGRERSVVVIGDVSTYEDGSIQKVHGYMLDLTEGQRQYADRAGTEAVRAAAEHRAAIEQAKGALMLAYGVSPDVAVSVLRWHSQQNNVKLHLIAERLVTTLRRPDLASVSTRRVLDRILHDLARDGREL